MRKAERNEVEAMQVICNIQAMQQAINKTSWTYASFNRYTIEELRQLQESYIQKYNAHLLIDRYSQFSAN